MGSLRGLLLRVSNPPFYRVRETGTAKWSHRGDEVDHRRVSFQMASQKMAMSLCRSQWDVRETEQKPNTDFDQNFAKGLVGCYTIPPVTWEDLTRYPLKSLHKILNLHSLSSL
ncbi:hypothetical protein ANRL4_01797 [Anaerolineae bacterium]|nr:hypothetical protein ANRL4_01797 [Anaerolineae bacterium]